VISKTRTRGVAARISDLTDSGGVKALEDGRDPKTKGKGKGSKSSKKTRHLGFGRKEELVVETP